MTNTIVDSNEGNSVAALAFITGTLLGAAAALLLAPQSGRKTRRDLRQFAEKTGNKLGTAQLEVRHSVENIVGDVSEKLQEGLNGGLDWTDSKLADLQSALDIAKKSFVETPEKSQSD